LFLEDKSICIFIEDLLQSLEKDKLDDEFNILKTEMSLLHERFSQEKNVDGSMGPQRVCSY